MAARIRHATVDAAQLLALKRTLDHKTSFMLLESGERATTAAELADELRGELVDELSLARLLT